MHRYVTATNDRSTLRQLLPTLKSIVDASRRGNPFGIGVDTADGLLRQGAEGYQLTWMDAKVGRLGRHAPARQAGRDQRALDNALRLITEWLQKAIRWPSRRMSARRVRESFNRRYWYADGGYLYDVIDGEGATIRPAVRIRSSRCRSITPCSTASAGGSSTWSAIACSRPLDFARWRPVIVTTRRITTGSPFARRGLSPGNRVGLGWSARSSMRG